jgi:hypothetical protein
MMEAVCSSESSVHFQWTTRRYIPEDNNPRNHRCENLKSYARQPARPPARPPACLPAYNIYLYLSIYPSVYLSVCLPTHPPTYLPTYLSLYNPLLDLGGFFRFLILYTVGRTPWTGDQPDARPIPIQHNTNTEQTHTYIHVLSGIRTHEPSVRAGEDILCLRPHGHCGRLNPTRYSLYCI